MSDTVITVTGNVGWAPTRKVLAGGTVVTDFRVANTPRRFDKTANVWRDLETQWYGVTCWRGLADNVATCVQKGDRVVVTGKLLAKSWVTKEGEQRSGWEIDATAVGFDLSRATAVLDRSSRGVERTAGSEAGPDAWATGPSADPITGEVAAQAA